MNYRLVFVVPVLFFSVSVFAQNRVITGGMTITRSTTFKKANYFLPAKSAAADPVLVIEGNDLVIDFNNAALHGSDTKTNPDNFAGNAVLIKNSRRVTIRNLRARGYKIAIRAINVEDLVIENCDFSYNYRQRLNSTQEKEDLSDWMSYHQNEKDEWLRYGAAIYLRDCERPVVRETKVTGGQNALMMTACNNGKIYNNDFSFNSGIGIGMYRSGNNQVMFNKLIFNVRGYSHGVYNRGQDSAGILVYEQSSGNTFYKNAATHSGDGFFLWAGQSTMDTGKGGCNDNLVMGNDFSYAPTNGIEITFSRNMIIRNRIYECDHGIWGGYSYDTRITDNKFRNNRIGIAIEHGQRNTIGYNVFYNEKEAIRLWARAGQPADWGYAKYRDTRSVTNWIFVNSFNNNEVALKTERTDSLYIAGNAFTNVDHVMLIDSFAQAVDSTPFEMPDLEMVVPAVDKPRDPFSGIGKLAGRKQIRMTEWGPYDFRYPIMWQTNPAGNHDTLELEVLGPPGKWQIRSMRGLSWISAKTGEFPATLKAVASKGVRTDIEIALDYKGTAVTTALGLQVAAGTAYRFYFRKFFQPLNWEVRWFSLDTAFHNPLRSPDLFAPNVRMTPVKTEQVKQLDYAWWGGIKTDKGTIQPFMTLAEATADLMPGQYELAVTWDDAVRVYVDDKLVLDEWDPSNYKFDESPHRRVRVKLGGKHRFRVEHIELGGFATLGVKLKKLP